MKRQEPTGMTGPIYVDGSPTKINGINSEGCEPAFTKCMLHGLYFGAHGNLV